MWLVQKAFGGVDRKWEDRGKTSLRMFVMSIHDTLNHILVLRYPLLNYFLERGPWTSSITTTWEFVDILNLRLHPRPLETECILTRFPGDLHIHSITEVIKTLNFLWSLRQEWVTLKCSSQLDFESFPWIFISAAPDTIIHRDIRSPLTSMSTETTTQVLRPSPPALRDSEDDCPRLQHEKSWARRNTDHHQEKDSGKNREFSNINIPLIKKFWICCIGFNLPQPCFNWTFIIVKAEIIPLAFQAVIKLAV